MNTDIIKGRAKSGIELYDTFNQPLHLYDGVIVENCGMRLDLIIQIDNDKSIRLYNCTGKKYSSSLVLANKIVGDKAIKDLQNKYFSQIAAAKKAKEERIHKKAIFGMWKNRNTNRFGICNIVISSRPGKQVLRSEIKNKINEVKDFCDKNPNYIFSFFGKTNMTTNLDEAYVYPEGDVERNIFNFIYDRQNSGLYSYIENPITGKEEFKNILNESFFLTIYDSGENIVNSKIMSKYIPNTFCSSNTYAMQTMHTMYGFYSKNMQKIYCNFCTNTLLQYTVFRDAFKAFQHC